MPGAAAAAAAAARQADTAAHADRAAQAHFEERTERIMHAVRTRSADAMHALRGVRIRCVLHAARM